MLRLIIKILLFPISLLLSILIAFMTFLLSIGTVLLYFLMILCVVGAIASFIQKRYNSGRKMDAYILPSTG